MQRAEHDPAVHELRAELGAALSRHSTLSADQRAAALAELLQGLLKEHGDDGSR
ncbi:MAG: hypothetical protein HC828_02915 [Blastochloris sp.]|nr:hypothetical protein [Blastochloris sp.]